MTCDYCIYGAKGAISKVVAGGKIGNLVETIMKGCFANRSISF